MRTWIISNGEERASESANFHIPERGEREAVKVGDHVKLRFVKKDVGIGPQGERMWVEVTRIKGKRFYGTVANDPVVIEGLAFGDEVEFGPEHVIGL